MSSLSASPPASAPAESNINSEHYDDQIRELANIDKEAHKELIENIAEFGEDEKNDEVLDDDDLWWNSSSPPPQFYTLVFDDDDVSVYSLDTDYADFLLPSNMLEDTRMPPDMSRIVMMPPNMSRNVMMPPDMSMNMTSKQENMLMKSVVQFLLIATPDDVYDPYWREKNIRKWIVPELLPVWTNAEDIFEGLYWQIMCAISTDHVCKYRCT